jgi:predicted nucleic acid-binding protein
VANTLVVAERRGRINRAAAAAFLDLLAALPIVVDPESATHAWAGVITLAREPHLSAYDAAYLELALRRGLPLATRDQRLASAAETLGVPVLL